MLKIDKKKAAEYFQKSAENGNIKSMYRYGLMLFYGNGIQENKELEIAYVKKSAENGYEKSMFFYVSIPQSWVAPNFLNSTPKDLWAVEEVNF